MSHHVMTDEEIGRYLSEPRRVAVIGMKPDGPALSVPKAMAIEGFDVVGVNPKYEDVDGFDVYPSVDRVPGRVDIVDVFRRSEAVADHVDNILEMEPLPSVVWMQLGIKNDDVARELEEAGIRVVQDRCLKLEYNRLVKSGSG